MKKLVLMVAMVMVLGMWSSGALAYPADGYNAALNTLPALQGWTTQGWPYNGNTNHKVNGGIFYQTTDIGGSYYTERYATNILDFTSSELFVIQGEMKVNNSGSLSNGDLWRTGYSFAAFDNNLMGVYLGIAGDKVRLSNGHHYLSDNPLNSDSTPWITFDTTSVFNTYRIEVSSGNMNLFINGSSMGSLAVGNEVFSQTPESYKNLVYFGDGTRHAGSQTELKYVTFGGNGAPVPVPAAVWLLGSGLMGLLGVRRKISK